MSVMATAFNGLRNVFGEDSFEWLDRSYIMDWYGLRFTTSDMATLQGSRGVATAAWLIAWIIKGLPPYEREFDRKDPLIDHKQHKSQ